MPKEKEQRAPATDQVPRVHRLVAFFDILGFRSLIANNDCEVVGNLVRRALHATPKKIKDHFDKRRFGARVKFIVVSDSVIVFQSPRDGVDLTNRNMAIPFISFCSVFSAWMLKNGLPVRGAIARGEYYTDQTGLVGKPLIEAYELANSLELAACAICPSAEDWVTKLEFDWPEAECRLESAIRKNFCLYRTPMKQGPAELYLLDNRSLVWKDREVTRSLIWELFTKHGKTCGTEVYSKIDNTVGFLSEFKPKSQ